MSYSVLPPAFLLSSHPLSFSCFLSFSLLTSLHLYSAAFAQIKLRLQFSPSQSTYLCFMTRTKSILCCYWFFFPLLLLPSCLNRHKPFCLLLPDSSHSCSVVTLCVLARHLRVENCVPLWKESSAFIDTDIKQKDITRTLLAFKNLNT